MARMKNLVVTAYTSHTITSSGLVRRKSRSQQQLNMAVARAVVAFAVDCGFVGSRTPESLWEALIDWAKRDGELVRPRDPASPSGLRPLQHRLDYQLEECAEAG